MSSVCVVCVDTVRRRASEEEPVEVVEEVLEHGIEACYATLRTLGHGEGFERRATRVAGSTSIIHAAACVA